ELHYRLPPDGSKGRRQIRNLREANREPTGNLQNVEVIQSVTSVRWHVRCASETKDRYVSDRGGTEGHDKVGVDITDRVRGWTAVDCVDSRGPSGGSRGRVGNPVLDGSIGLVRGHEGGRRQCVHLRDGSGRIHRNLP